MPSAAKPKPVVLRKLGPMECFQLTAANLDLYDNTLVACHYTIPAELVDPAHQDKLSVIWENAVAKVVLAHPLLQAGIHNIHSKKPSFVLIDTIDLSNHIQWRMIDPDKGENYDLLRKEIYTEELSRKYPSIETQPGWRLVILGNLNGPKVNDMEAMFGFHHAFIDGMSAKIFHEDLLKALNASAFDMTDQAVQNHIFRTKATPATTPPPQDTAIRFKNTIPNTAATLFYELTPHKILATVSSSTRSLAQKCKSWPPLTRFDSKTMLPVTYPVKSHYTTFSIEPAVLSGILAACRANKTTLTALLHIGVLVALVAQVKAEDTGSIVRAGTIIELRRHIKPYHGINEESHPLRDPSRVMANMVTKMLHTFGAEEDEADLLERIRHLAAAVSSSGPGDGGEAEGELHKIVWTLAARVRSEIQARLDLGVKNETVGLLKYVTDWKAYFKDALNKPRQSSWVVTNIGVMEGGQADEAGEEEDKKPWSIGKASFTASAEVAGAGLAVSSVTVRGGELCVDFSWEVGVIEDELGEEVARGVERLLRGVGEQNK